MKIFVTGSAGFIGHRVVNMLEQQGHEVASLDNFTNYGIVKHETMSRLHHERIFNFRHHPENVDIRDNDEVHRVIGNFNPDTVIHLAAFPRAKLVSLDPSNGVGALSTGLMNLLMASRKCHVRRFIYISSSMVYGDFNSDPQIAEEVCEPKGLYGIYKYAGELAVKEFKLDFNYTILRPSAVYGPTDIEDRVISKFLYSAARNKTLTVRGADERLDFTYVDDTAAGIVAAATAGATGNGTYNVTRGQSITLLEAAKIIQARVGKGTIDIVSRDDSFGRRGTLDIAPAIHDFGFNPRVDFVEGIDRYYGWLKESNLL